jgi:hypothetical protein
MPNVTNLFSGSEDEEVGKRVLFVKMMIGLGEKTCALVNAGHRILFSLANMSPDQYVKATTTLMAWNKMDLVAQELALIIDRLKEDNVSLNFDFNVFDGLVTQISELHFKIEKIYVEKTPEELALEKPSSDGSATEDK